MTDKVRENRLRRMATRRGLKLERCPRRDPGAIDYGTYRLMDAGNVYGRPVAAEFNHAYGLTLDRVEKILNGYTP